MGQMESEMNGANGESEVNGANGESKVNGAKRACV